MYENKLDTSMRNFNPALQNSNYHPHYNFTYTDHNNHNTTSSYDHQDNFPQQQKLRYLQKMFCQAKTLINLFLDNLASLFKKYSIRYPVNQYENALIRMLLPIQINSLISKHQIQCYFIKQPLKLKHNKITIENDTINKQDIYTLKNQYKKKLDEKTSFPYKSKQIQGPYEKTSLFQSFQKQKRPRHTVRSRGIEDQLCFWILNELQKGNLVTKAIISQKGRQLCKQKRCQFKACPRWCDNFLNRHLQLKNLVYKRVAEFNDNKKKIKIYDQLNNKKIDILDLSNDQQSDINIDPFIELQNSDKTKYAHGSYYKYQSEEGEDSQKNQEESLEEIEKQSEQQEQNQILHVYDEQECRK